MKKALLIVSLIVNVFLVVAIVWLHGYSRDTAFKAVADATDAEIRLQQYILKEIESDDSTRIQAVKEMLRRNIAQGKKSAAVWRRAAD